MPQRIARKLTDVAVEVEQQLKSHFKVTIKQLEAWRSRAHALPYGFPESSRVDIDRLWIDYEVQRDVLYKHIINIMQKWDPRICSPGSACCIGNDSRIYLYDAQHRTVAAAILGYKEVPCAVVNTTDPNFASYAFEMLNDTGVKRLTPGDLHRNALVRWKNGSRDKRNVDARVLQVQFDALKIDLQDKSSRNSPNLRGDNDYFFSHFKYAQKAIDVDDKGRVLYAVLKAIKETFPLQEEIDQGVFIGLWQLNNWSKEMCIDQPKGWMKSVLKEVAKKFDSSHTVHDMAKAQWTHVVGNWSAPDGAAKFLREVYKLHGGKLTLPYKGHEIGIADRSNVCDALKPALGV